MSKSRSDLLMRISTSICGLSDNAWITVFLLILTSFLVGCTTTKEVKDGTLEAYLACQKEYEESGVIDGLISRHENEDGTLSYTFVEKSPCEALQPKD